MPLVSLGSISIKLDIDLNGLPRLKTGTMSVRHYNMKFKFRVELDNRFWNLYFPSASACSLSQQTTEKRDLVPR